MTRHIVEEEPFKRSVVLGAKSPDQLQRPRTLNLENSRKTAGKGAEWPPGKVPGKQPKNSRTASQIAEKQLFCVLRKFFRVGPIPRKEGLR